MHFQIIANTTSSKIQTEEEMTKKSNNNNRNLNAPQLKNSLVIQSKHICHQITNKNSCNLTNNYGKVVFQVTLSRSSDANKYLCWNERLAYLKQKTTLITTYVHHILVRLQFLRICHQQKFKQVRNFGLLIGCQVCLTMIR